MSEPVNLCSDSINIIFGDLMIRLNFKDKIISITNPWFSKAPLTSAEKISEFARNISDTIREPLVILDKYFRVVNANHSFYNFFKVSQSETIGTLIYDLGNHQWDIPKLRELLEIILPQKSPFNDFEVEHFFPSIGKKTMLLNARQVETSSDKEKIILLAIEDITHRKESEEKLKASELRYRGLFEFAKDGILILDAVTGMIVDVNPFLIELLGYSHEEFCGKAIWEIGLFKDIVANKDQFVELQTKEYVRYEGLPLETKNKKRINVEFVSNVYLVDNLPVIQCNIRDITEKILLINELTIARDKAEESCRVKSNFLSNMSHELRTPLIGILGYSDILSSDSDNQSIAAMAEVIHKCGKRLLETLNLILNLARVEAGGLDVKKEMVDVAVVLNEVIELFSEVAAKKNLYIKKEFSALITKTKTDFTILGEIFNNLLNNAIKFTHNGGITVSIENKNTLGGCISVSFRDTGIGINEEFLNLIWEEFRQVSEGYNRGFEGSGLGLTLTKKFAEKLGGTISVQSEIGIGSVFTIDIPVVDELSVKNTNVVPEEKSLNVPVVMQSYYSSKRILLVENDPIAVDYLKLLLQSKCQLDFCTDGLSSVEKTKAIKYDFILMDINLGFGFNGLEAVKQIRCIDGYQYIPIAAMTAFAMKGDKEEFISAGCTHYLSKPFSKEDLFGLLDKIFENKSKNN